MEFQEKLLKVIDSYIDKKQFPHTLLLEGLRGCGKYTLVQYVSKKMNIDVIDLTDNISLDTLNDIALSVTPHIYYIDGNQLSIKEQNAILKFLEEPLKNAYIILTITNKGLLLPTVLNRCVILTFDVYTKDQLRTFLDGPEVILEYALTPGQVKEFAKYDIKAMETFANKVLTQIGVANYSNILKIPNNINFTKEESDLYHFDTFVHILLYVANNLYKEGRIPYEMFKIITQFNSDLNIPRINKQQLFENFIVNLKRVIT